MAVCLEPTYEGLKLSLVAGRRVVLTSGLEPTYEGLKRHDHYGPGSRSGRFGAYL